MAFRESEGRQKSVKELVKSGEHDVALAQCNALLAEQPESNADILRLRAYVYAHRGMFDEAIADRKTILCSGAAMLRDLYQLADNLLSAGRFEEAGEWFQEVLRGGAEQNETWFDSAALLLLSYTQLRLGRLHEAEMNLEKAVAIDAECAMPVRGEGIVTHQSLRNEIRRRAGGFTKR